MGGPSVQYEKPKHEQQSNSQHSWHASHTTHSVTYDTVPFPPSATLYYGERTPAVVIPCLLLLLLLLLWVLLLSIAIDASALHVGQHLLVGNLYNLPLRDGQACPHICLLPYMYVSEYCICVRICIYVPPRSTLTQR